MRRVLSVTLAVACASLWTLGCSQKNTADTHKSMFPDLIKEDIKVGTGPKVEDGDLVLVTYSGKLAKGGEEFETNDPARSDKNKNPLPITAGKQPGTVVGVATGILGMQVGGQRKLSIPWQKGYGAMGNDPKIPGYADLIFDVKVLYIVKKGEEETVEIEDVAPGSGPEVKAGDKVTINYKGYFVNNRLFDDRSTADKAVTFVVGQREALSGLDQGMVGMKVGGKRKMTIPPGAGWGSYGHDVVGGNQVLIYEVSLNSISK